jgi:[acyl-carrier-protein] S-malonyltransferase
MKKKIAFVFPGQGSQRPFMGQSFYGKYLETRMAFQEAEDVLSMNIVKVIFTSNEEALKKVDFCQIAIFVTSLAIFRAMKKEFPDIEPAVCGGLSLGEYTALVAAKKVDYKTLLPIVKKRADFMNNASRRSPQGMSAVIGLAEELIPDHYEIANVNAPGQIVIAGSLDEMDAAAAELKELGARRVMPLKVAGAFHTSYMTKARNKLKPFVQACKIKENNIDFVMNVSGELAKNVEDLKEGLVEQVHRKTRWHDCMRTMDKMEVDYISCGPRQLSSLYKKMNTVNSFITIDEIQDLEGLYEKV